MSRMGFLLLAIAAELRKSLTSLSRSSGNVRAIARTGRAAGWPHRFRRVTEGTRDARRSEPSAGAGKRYIPEPNYVPLRAAAGVPKAVQDVRKTPESLAPSIARALGTRVADGGCQGGDRDESNESIGDFCRSSASGGRARNGLSAVGRRRDGNGRVQGQAGCQAGRERGQARRRRGR